MDTTQISMWSDVATFPLLTIMTLAPLMTMAVVLWMSSSVTALRIGLLGTAVTLGLGIYLLSLFDTTLSGVQLYEQTHFSILTYSVGVDGANVLFVVLTTVLAFLAVIYVMTTAQTIDRVHVACLLGYEAILIGAFSALNTMQFWMWCVLELLPIVFITLRTGYGQNRRWAVSLLLQYWGGGLLMTLLGFFLLALGVMGTGDVFTFDWFALKDHDQVLEYGTLIFFLLFFGFAIRMPLFPFHGWLPVLAEQGSMASLGVFLVGLKLGIYATVRYILPILPEIAAQWMWFVLILGLVSIFYGALLAFMQINVRRLIAFAVISHTGVLAIGIFDFNSSAMEGSLLLSIAYGLATAGMLFSVGMIYKRTSTIYIPRLGGMFDVSYAIAFLFLIGALSTIAMPGTPSFDGAHLLIEGTIRGFGWLVSIVILIGNVLVAGLLLWTFQQIFMAVPKRFQVNSDSGYHSDSALSARGERTIAGIVCALLLGIGFHTTPWVHIIDQNMTSIDTQKTVAHNSYEDVAGVNLISKDNENE